jgi:signal transduction histidine kinase
MIIDVLTELKQIPEFKNVPEQQLVWLAENGHVNFFEDGEKAFKKGQPVTDLRIILKGEVALYIEQQGNLRSIANFLKGDITGKLPFSRIKTSPADGIAIGETGVFCLSEAHFPEMIRSHHALIEVFVHVMTDRVRDMTKAQQQNDKMMALGKLSAGLAHELNNPSAAVVRSAHELKKHLSNIPNNFKRVIKIRTSDDVVEKVNDLVFSKIEKYGKTALSMMQRTELEDQLTDWLDVNGIDKGYEMAEMFAEFSMYPDDLDSVKSWLREEDKAPVIGWLHQVLTTERLVGEIEEAANRINKLVTSVKGYTHMDQAPEKQLTDIHVGIRNTLVMLNHKLKKNNVKLVENYQVDLPQANIFISEMNQVWTNIIDNAIDAMEGRARNVLEIKTERKDNFINVSIVDNGPGIPQEIQGLIFDPFFTTKAIGKGTGLGLEVANQIIHQHNGKIYLNSHSGRTEFVICFPF